MAPVRREIVRSAPMRRACAWKCWVLFLDQGLSVHALLVFLHGCWRHVCTWPSYKSVQTSCRMLLAGIYLDWTRSSNLPVFLNMLECKRNSILWDMARHDLIPLGGMSENLEFEAWPALQTWTSEFCWLCKFDESMLLLCHAIVAVQCDGHIQQLLPSLLEHFSSEVY